MATRSLAHASVMTLDPAGGSSYETIVCQTTANFTIANEQVEITAKCDGQWKKFLTGNRSVAGSLAGRISSDPALDFDGSTEYAHVADDAALDLAADVTIETIITPDAVSGTQMLVHKHDGNDGYILQLNGDEVEFVIDNSGATDSTTATDAANLVAGTQYKIKAVYDGGTTAVKIYVDDSDEAVTTTGTIPATCGVNATRLTLAADAAGANNYDGKMFVAAIADLGVFNTQRLLPTDCVAYYRLDGDLTDETSNSLDLTGVNIAAADYGDLTYHTIRESARTKTAHTIQLSEDGTGLTYTGDAIFSNVTQTYGQSAPQDYTVDFVIDGAITEA